MRSRWQVGNLQGAAQLLSKAAGAASGTLADLVSPARMVILGAALTAASKPMYAAAGGVAALGGTTACLYWLAFAKVGRGCGCWPLRAACLQPPCATARRSCPAQRHGSHLHPHASLHAHPPWPDL